MTLSRTSSLDVISVSFSFCRRTPTYTTTITEMEKQRETYTTTITEMEKQRETYTTTITEMEKQRERKRQTERERERERTEGNSRDSHGCPSSLSEYIW